MWSAQAQPVHILAQDSRADHEERGADAEQDRDPVAHRVQPAPRALGVQVVPPVVEQPRLGVRAAYTLEATYSGFTHGKHAGMHVSTGHLERLGAHVCASLLEFDEAAVRSRISLAIARGLAPRGSRYDDGEAD